MKKRYTKYILIVAGLTLLAISLSLVALRKNNEGTIENNIVYPHSTENIINTTTSTTVKKDNIERIYCKPTSDSELIEETRIIKETDDPLLLNKLKNYPNIELLSKFTTCHEPNKTRVINIQKMADLVRGVVLKPKESFSLNNFVGERTSEKGFVPSNALGSAGLFTTIGGGISQFTTTFFNSAFFAGLDIPKSRPHSFYFSRYPYGREATLNWNPVIDLEIKNNTNNDIIVWTSYTEETISVSIYGVPFLKEVLELEPIIKKIKNCTSVEIIRERIYKNNENEKDSFFALYRDSMVGYC